MTFFLFPTSSRVLYIGLFIFLVSAAVKSEEIQSELGDENVQLVSEEDTINEVLTEEIETGDDEENDDGDDDDEFSTCSKQNILGATACKKICGSVAVNGKGNSSEEGESETQKQEELDLCVETKTFEGIVCDCSSIDVTPPEICDAKLSRVFPDLETEEDCADFCTAQEKLAYGCRVNVDSDFVPICACFADLKVESGQVDKRAKGPYQGPVFRRVCKRPGKNKYCKKKRPGNKKPKPRPRPPVEGEETTESKYPKKPIKKRLELLLELVKVLDEGIGKVGKGFGDVSKSIKDLTVCVKDDHGIFTFPIVEDKETSDTTATKT